MQRREFLKISGIAGGGLMMSVLLPGTANAIKQAPNTLDMHLYVKILTNNDVVIMAAKQEMGQGVATSLPMIVTEELDADWNKVSVSYLNFDKKIPGYEQPGSSPLMGSGGSMGVLSSWDEMRKAGATVRAMLVTAAANRWKIATSDCYTEQGLVKNRLDNKKFTYGELAEEASTLKVPEDIELKPRKSFKLIGKPTIDTRVKDIVTGKLKYSIDYQEKDLVFASLSSLPAIGSKVVSYDKAKVLALPGVIDVVEIPSFPKTINFNGVEGGVVVIAKTQWAAYQGRQALDDTLDWDLGAYGKKDLKTLQQDFDQALKGELNLNYEKGDALAVLDENENQLEATYTNPYIAHALMEPLNATAWVRNNACDLWTGTQSPQYTSHDLSRILEIPIENFTVHCHPSGGGFGRRYFTDFCGQAALISKAISKKVKLVWTREDEIQHGKYHPFRQDHYRGSHDADGNMQAMHFRGITVHEWGAGSSPLYHIPNIREESKIVDTIIPFGSWRSVIFHNRVFGKESFIDEMAHLAGKDPIDFRIEHLSKAYERIKDLKSEDHETMANQKVIPRYIEVLELLKERSGWGNSLPAGEGLGVAISDLGHGGATADWHKAVCGQVVHVKVNNGKWRIKKVYVVMYLGTIVNPLGVRAQIEGSINWALTPMIYDSISVKNGKVVESNFHDYKVLKMKGAPEIDIHLIDSDDRPNGAGEPAVPPLAPAIMNAVFAASGKRYRDMPLKEIEYELG